MQGAKPVELLLFYWEKLPPRSFSFEVVLILVSSDDTQRSRTLLRRARARKRGGVSTLLVSLHCLECLLQKLPVPSEESVLQVCALQGEWIVGFTPFLVAPTSQSQSRNFLAMTKGNPQWP